MEQCYKKNLKLCVKNKKLVHFLNPGDSNTYGVVPGGKEKILWGYLGN